MRARTRLLLSLAAACLLTAGLALVLAQRPRRATTQGPSPRQGTNAARTIRVRAGGDLRRAIEQARPGDTVVLEAGASFTGPFTLPNKGASEEWITLRSSTPDSQLPGESERVSPSHAPLLAKLLAPGGGEAALQTAPGAHHWRLVGLEIRPARADALVYDLVKLGDGSNAQDAPGKVPHHLVIDRCLITAFPKQTLKRGVALNSAETSVVNSYIAGFKSDEQDAQAIAGWNGPGPFHVVNNYLEASGENLIFGGTPPSVPGLVPTDIEVRRNHFFKPLSWRQSDPSYAGTRWNVKNLFELKSARRVVVEGNVFENNWGDINWGYGTINLTVRGDSGPQATIEDVVIRNNLITHAPNGFNILGKDTEQPSRRGRGLKIVNNLFVDIDGKRWSGDGEWIKISDMPDVTVDHNTVFHTGTLVQVYGPQSTGFTFTNNVARHNSYGVIGADHGPGSETLRAFMPGAIFRRNVIVGHPAMEGYPYFYPPDNFYPQELSEVGFANFAAGDYRLSAASPYKRRATDRVDVGCDIEALNAAIEGVVRR